MTNNQLTAIFFTGCVFALWFILEAHVVLPHWVDAIFATAGTVGALTALLSGVSDE